MTLGSIDHLTLDAVVAYADGEMPMVSYQRAAAHVARCPQCDAEVRAQLVARSWLRSAEAPAMPTSLLDTLRSIPVALPTPARRRRPAPDGIRTGSTDRGGHGVCRSITQCPPEPPVSFPGRGCAGRGADRWRAGRGRADSPNPTVTRTARRSPMSARSTGPQVVTAGWGNSVAVPADDNRSVPNGSPTNGSQNGSPATAAAASARRPSLDPVQVGAYARPGGVNGSFGPRPQRGPVAARRSARARVPGRCVRSGPGEPSIGRPPRGRDPRRPNRPPEDPVAGSGVGCAAGPARRSDAGSRQHPASSHRPNGSPCGRRCSSGDCDRRRSSACWSPRW